MSRSQINAWTAAHMTGFGPGHTPPPSPVGPLLPRAESASPRSSRLPDLSRYVARRLEADKTRGVDAKGHIRVNIEGLPRGARTQTRLSGMIKRLAVGRGHPAASE